MAEVTSGKNLTVIVLDETEAEALSRLLHNTRADDHAVLVLMRELAEALD